MVKSPKSGRELEALREPRPPWWAEKFFALFGIRGVDDADEDDR